MPMTRAHWGMIAAGVVVFVLVASQVLIPPLGAHQVEDRLEVGGGTADVTMGAVPALRLLWGDGERLEVDAHDLDLPLDRDLHVFDDLDGFGIVDVSIANSHAGPFDLTSFSLTRDGPGPYHMVTSGQTTAADLVDYGIDGVELPGSSVLDGLMELFLGPSDDSIPVSLDMQLASDEGVVRVLSGESTVEGIPAGPVGAMITSAIVNSI
jgi:hypothetical protein